MQIKAGSTDRSVILRVVDSTDGTPETGVAYNTSGIDLWYRRDGGAKVSITEASLAAVDSAHSDGGFIHIGDGYCRLDPPDAAFAAGSTGVIFGGTITGMVVIGTSVQLVAFDPSDSVRLGLTALPNASADAAGGLPVSDAGGLDLDAMNAAAVRFSAARAQAIDDWINGGRLDLILDIIAADVAGLDGAAMRGTDNAATAASLVTAQTDLTTLLTRWSAARAGYVDNLNVGGLVASQQDTLNIGNNTRVRASIPQVLERPDSSSESVTLVLELYDALGNMEAPDSTPTVELLSQDGTDVSSRVSALSNPSTGRYTFTYTNAAAHALETLRWKVTVVEGGATRTYSYLTLLVDTTAVDFTSADRAMVSAIKAITDALPNSGALSSLAQGTDITTLLTNVSTLLTRWTATRAGYVDNLSAGAVATSAAVAALNNLSSVQAQAAAAAALAAYDPPTRAEATSDKDAVIAALPVAPDNASILAVKVWTDRLGTAMEVDGSVYRFTTNALELAPAGGGGGGGGSGTLTVDERNAVADALLDRVNGIETGISMRHAMRAIAAMLAGVISGANASTGTVKALGRSKVRVTMVTDEDGNRTSVVLDLTDET